MSRKFKQAEDAVTSRVMPLLDRKLYGWTLTEQQLPFIEDTKHPDMMAVRKGRETIAIEAKSYNNPDDGIETVREKYLGKSLTAKYVGVSDTLEVGPDSAVSTGSDRSHRPCESDCPHRGVRVLHYHEER